jgi:hypothetical protein
VTTLPSLISFAAHRGASVVIFLFYLRSVASLAGVKQDREYREVFVGFAAILRSAAGERRTPGIR